MTKEKWFALIYGLVAFLLVFQGNDISLFLGEARDVLALHSPYHVPQAINPLSVALVFSPLSFLPDAAVLRLVAFVGVSLYAYAVLREKRNWAIALILLSSPIFLYDVFYANIDWMAFLALFVPPVPSFLLAMVKPQVGLGVAAIALLRIWDKNRKLAIILVAIEGAVYLASFAWGMRWGYALVNSNWSLFPYGIILGIPLMIIALKKKDMVLALAAMPLLSPYVGPQSWISVLPLLSRFNLASILRRFLRLEISTDSNKAQTCSYPTFPPDQSLSRS